MFKLEDVSFKYNKTAILFEKVNFTCHDHKLGLIGGNGSGKTTLLKLLANIIIPEEGKIEINESSYLSVYDFTNYGLFTMQDFLDLILRLQSFDGAQLEMHLTGLGIKKYLNYEIKALSQGTKKKLGILCTFLSTRDILLIDEPFESVDEASIAYIEHSIIESDKKIIVVEHNKERLRKMMDVVIEIDEIKRHGVMRNDV